MRPISSRRSSAGTVADRSLDAMACMAVVMRPTGPAMPCPSSTLASPVSRAVTRMDAAMTVKVSSRFAAMRARVRSRSLLMFANSFSNGSTVAAPSTRTFSFCALSDR